MLNSRTAKSLICFSNSFVEKLQNHFHAQSLRIATRKRFYFSRPQNFHIRRNMQEKFFYEIIRKAHENSLRELLTLHKYSQITHSCLF